MCVGLSIPISRSISAAGSVIAATPYWTEIQTQPSTSNGSGWPSWDIQPELSVGGASSTAEERKTGAASSSVEAQSHGAAGRIPLRELWEYVKHGHPVSQLCCTIYIMAAREMFLGEKDKEAALRAGFKKGYEDSCACHFPEIKAIEKNVHMKSPKTIKSDGYVVNTLTAAFWCFLHTNSYEKCVRTAIKLGDDTDTTAAVAGGLAGIYYGFEKIPKYYLENLGLRHIVWIYTILLSASSSWLVDTAASTEVTLSTDVRFRPPWPYQ